MSAEGKSAEGQVPVYAPLAGVRILDMATVVAAPFGATLCADLGADTVKLELPAGTDTLRTLAPVVDGKPVWWKVANRGKRGITLDVRKPTGRELLLRMLPRFDVLVENFRTGTMAGWGLDTATLLRANPRLVVLRLTGFGQTGPYARRPGFARVFEAMTGYTSLTRSADGTPLHADFPLGDAVAGLFAAFCISAEMVRLRGDPQERGREVDLAASEALLRLLDPIAAEHILCGTVRQPRGSSASYTAPSNIYRSAEGVHFSMAASSDEMFRRLSHGLGRADWLADPRFGDNAARRAHAGLIDNEVAQRFADLSFADITALLDRIAVPFSKVNDIRDVLADPHFSAREVIVSCADPDFGALPTACVVPRSPDHLPMTPVVGPGLGQHNSAFYGEMGLQADELERLRADGVI